jgi:hypothetical protein
MTTEAWNAGKLPEGARVVAVPNTAASMVEVGWVLVESAENDQGKQATPHITRMEVLDLPMGRHPLYANRGAGVPPPDLMQRVILHLEAEALYTPSERNRAAIRQLLDYLRAYGVARPDHQTLSQQTPMGGGDPS